jgi:SAM-dependent methyltransferase
VTWWEYDSLPSRWPYDWAPATRGDRIWDQLDFHLDLGCGRVPKGRLGIDHRESARTGLAIDLNMCLPADEGSVALERTWELYYQRAFNLGVEEGRFEPGSYPDYDFWEVPGNTIRAGLPFPDESIGSIITHHCLEHIGHGFEFLMEECHRVLVVGGVMRVIVPLFPSHSAVAEYDHKRYFMEGTFIGFCEDQSGARQTDGFAEPYNSCKFIILDEDYSPPTSPDKQWAVGDAREMRITLWKHGGELTRPDPFALVPKGV